MNAIVRMLLLSLVWLVVSCGVQKRDYEVVLPLTVNEDLLKSDVSDTLFSESDVTISWWSAFKDPVLDSLIKKAQQHNLDINTAVANYQAAKALVKERKFDRWPTITANAGYTRERMGENVFVQGENPTYSTYSGSLDASWEADLFGRVTNRIKGAYATKQQAVADMHGVYLSIYAEVATNYLALRGTQYRIDIAKRNLKGQQETYDLTLQLAEAGTSNQLDVSRALAQLEATRATIPQLKAQLEALKNSLSVLVGEVPGGLEDEIISPQPLPSLPKTVSLGNIEELLRRRPDVRRAEAALQIRISEYNISVADLYPKISFNGSIGFSAVDFSNFGSNSSFTWSVIPRISWAAFNLGRVKQQINSNDAKTLAALSQYEKAVLQGLEDIKTAMSDYGYELKRREILRTSSKASSEAAQIAQQRYNAGLDNFIDYLSAENTLLVSQNALALSEIASATSLVSIYKALGGGWELLTPEDLDQKYESMKVAEKKWQTQK
ncbi:hypothetical protein I215_11973 [Galbibacter marinus]|uniref:NodT family RND efflux system outer membrane lipoprotein n=1 Tax=Galbibacter marinus TaxID=555500 RepID=K2QIL1_9FLAO|nr:TolC family protein [Galbibacter marinus]EKF54567.1 hypothetical protein I215_11973 [Galbibacter marinus]